MLFSGVQNTSLIDFPGRVATTVFTGGCNFRCPYCHNPAAVTNLGNITKERILQLLTTRAGRVNAIVVSGGEPTIHKDLPDFMVELRNLDFYIKLDTNGSNPDMLEYLIKEGLVDYVAMDVKTDPECYPIALWSNAGRHGAVAEAIKILRDSSLQHEFRVTCADPFVTQKHFASIVSHVGDSPLYLQKVKLDGNVLDPIFFEFGNGYGLEDFEIDRLQAMAGSNCVIRGREGQASGASPK